MSQDITNNPLLQTKFQDPSRHSPIWAIEASFSKEMLNNLLNLLDIGIESNQGSFQKEMLFSFPNFFEIHKDNHLSLFESLPSSLPRSFHQIEPTPSFKVEACHGDLEEEWSPYLTLEHKVSFSVKKYCLHFPRRARLKALIFFIPNPPHPMISKPHPISPNTSSYSNPYPP